MTNQPTNHSKATSEKTPHGSWLLRPQRRLGQVGLVVLITLANTIIPFSIDMYTPAVPSLPAYFDTNEQMVNFTLMGFFLFMTLSSLVFGPVSDRFGRRPILVGSLVTYTIGGVLCALSGSIGMLIASRLVQAVGAGALMAVSMALIKDCFVEERREQMIALLQVLSVTGPVIAPLIGGILLSYFTWHASFVALAAFGGICLALALLFEESLPVEERSSGGVMATLGGLVKVGRNRTFMTLLFIVACFNVAFSSYLAVGSYVYVDYFGTTPQQYTYFFAAAAAFTALGPFIWLRASAKVSARKFTHILMVLALIASLVLLTLGPSSPFIFCACMIAFALVQSAMRPYTTNILLSQQQGDTGSASSLINFVFSIFGVFGMTIIVGPWPSFIFGIGVIMLVSTLVACALWIALLRSPFMNIKEFK